MRDDCSRFLILDGIAGVPLGREIAATLSALGHTTHHFDCLAAQERSFYALRAAWSKVLKQANHLDHFYCFPRLGFNALERLVRNSKPKYILVIGFAYKFFDLGHLRALATENKAHLLLYDTDSCNLYDKRREFIYFIENELPIYDHIYSFSEVTTRFFKDARGLDATYLPFGATIQDASNGLKTCDVVFIGTCDLRRILLLESIRNHVTVRGNRWQRNAALISPALNERIDDRPIWGAELLTLLGSAKIVLNITRTDFYGAETGVNLRIFEALSAGCFLLTDHCDEIAKFFEVGREIETFRSSAELSDKVKYYLAHGESRERIARYAYEHFSERHAWPVRLACDFIPQLPDCL